MLRIILACFLLVGCSNTYKPTNTHDTLANHPSIGGGVLLNGDGWILSAAHVFTSCRKAEIKVNGFIIPLSVKKLDVLADMALAKADIKFTNTQNITLRKTAVKGESILAVGYPADTDNHITVEAGTIGNNAVDSFEMLAKIRPGFSGGGVFDKFGNLVGISYSRNSEKRGSAINPEKIVSFLSSAGISLSQENSLSAQDRIQKHSVKITCA